MIKAKELYDALLKMYDVYSISPMLDSIQTIVQEFQDMNPDKVMTIDDLVEGILSDLSYVED